MLSVTRLNTVRTLLTNAHLLLATVLTGVSLRTEINPTLNAAQANMMEQRWIEQLEMIVRDMMQALDILRKGQGKS